MPTKGSIEFESLLWSADRRLLAGQELLYWLDEPLTRVIVIDADQRARIAASRAHKGLCQPVRSNADALMCRHSGTPAGGEREPHRRFRLPVSDGRLTGLLRKKPWKRGFFYGPDSPATRQARPAAG
jgi:hypothetical protein